MPAHGSKSLLALCRTRVRPSPTKLVTGPLLSRAVSAGAGASPQPGPASEDRFLGSSAQSVAATPLGTQADRFFLTNEIRSVAICTPRLGQRRSPQGACS